MKLFAEDFSLVIVANLTLCVSICILTKCADLHLYKVCRSASEQSVQICR